MKNLAASFASSCEKYPRKSLSTFYLSLVLQALLYASYFKSVSISTGHEVDVSLVSGQDYGGSSISYSSSNTGIFTVSNDGKITPVSAGSAKLTYTITSSKGDTAKNIKDSVIQTDVIVKNYNTSSETITNAPIVTNLSVKARTTEEVWRFIQNGDDSYFEASANGSYTLDGIFLSV